jgi:C-terminal novel E3 ligase, LRR-interacting
MRLVDAVEVHLAYQTKFGERVLSKTQGMLYRHFAYLKDSDYAAAETALNAADAPQNVPARCEFLAQWAPWCEHLEATHTERFKAIKDKFDGQLEVLYRDDPVHDVSTLTEEQKTAYYLEKGASAGEIMAKRATALNDLVATLTQEAMRA